MSMYRCCVCNIEAGEGVTLMSLRAPGVAFMCGPCIEKEERDTRKHGVFFYRSGLRFLSLQEVSELPVRIW